MRAVVVAVALVVAACGPALRPSSLTELESIVREQDAEELEGAAAESWSEGKRYLRLAREALAQGDEHNADRFAELGIVHAKIAMATAREVKANERLEQARETRSEVDRELERVQSALTRLERELERERIRVHLTEALDELRLKAAADDELREQDLSEEELKQLKGARFEVAREMVGRAEVGLLALRALSSAGALDEERLLPVQGSLDSARKRLAAGDIAGVQEQVEIAGIETRRLWDEVWQPLDEGAAREAAKAIVEALERGGLEATEEELGVGALLATSTAGTLSKKGRTEARALAESLAALAEPGAVRLVVVAVDRTPPAAKPKKLKSGQARASDAAAAIVAAGLDERAVSHRGCGPVRPLVALQSGSSRRIAVLVVPIPKPGK
jgi:hypothetical protein